MKYLSPWVKEQLSTFRVAAARAAISRVIVAMLILTLCGAPEVLAQATQTSPPSQPPSQTQTTSQTPKPWTTLIPDPAQAPLQPVTSNLPDAPTPQQNPAPTAATQPPAETQQPQSQSLPQERLQQPLGAAAAEAAPPTGGAASKPAGTAIAPAKQRQVRSLLIKLGAIAAAGAALGTVYGLTRATSSVPPGASTAH